MKCVSYEQDLEKQVITIALVNLLQVVKGDLKEGEGHTVGGGSARGEVGEMEISDGDGDQHVVMGNGDVECRVQWTPT